VILAYVCIGFPIAGETTVTQTYQSWQNNYYMSAVSFGILMKPTAVGSGTLELPVVICSRMYSRREVGSSADTPIDKVLFFELQCFFNKAIDGLD